MSDKKIITLQDEELTTVAGGAAEQTGTVYTLTVDGPGRWYDRSGSEVSSISVLRVPPHPGFTLRYTGPDNAACTVSARPNMGHAYGSRGVIFDAVTNKYTATFE